MIEWLNFIVLLVIFLFLSMWFYVKSVGPAALEQKIGEGAYEKCAQYRKVSGLLLYIGMIGYIVYFFYPLPVPLPRVFPIPYVITASIAILILTPCGYLMYRGTKKPQLQRKNIHSTVASIILSDTHRCWEKCGQEWSLH